MQHQHLRRALHTAVDLVIDAIGLDASSVPAAPESATRRRRIQPPPPKPPEDAAADARAQQAARRAGLV